MCHDMDMDMVMGIVMVIATDMAMVMGTDIGKIVGMTEKKNAVCPEIQAKPITEPCRQTFPGFTKQGNRGYNSYDVWKIKTGDRVLDIHRTSREKQFP